MSKPVGVFGEPGDVLREVHEDERQALNAAGQHLAERYGCIVTIGDRPPEFHGSGTLVQIGNDVFVATAKHLFEKRDPDDRACFWWGFGSQHECVPVGDICWPSADVDVAAARLASAAPANATLLDNIDVNPLEDVSELWVISGISRTGVLIDHITRRFNVVWWTTGLCPLPSGRWPHIHPPPDPRRDLFAHYSEKHALDQNGEIMKAIDPHGFSGGGVWSICLAGSGVWSPDSASRLIGIQSATAAHGKWSWLRAKRIVEWLRVVRDNWPAAGAAINARFGTLLRSDELAQP